MKNETLLAIGIIGRICSGKSTLAKGLSSYSDIPVVSFGGYLKDFAEKKGLSTARKDLQDLGEKFINENPQKFLLDVIAHQKISRSKLLFEGIRHKIIVEEIKKLSKNTLFIYIDADIETRYARYNNRKKEGDIPMTFEEFELADNHPVEQEIDLLRKSCDLYFNSVVTNNDDIITSINASIQQLLRQN